jgi:hypothetical protein
VLFVPINYVMIAIHEGAHCYSAIITGGYATQLILHPSLFTGGESYCGGGIPEVVWCSGMLATSFVGLVAALWGGLLGRYVGLICGCRLYVGYTRLVMEGGWSDTTALLQIASPLAYGLLILASVMGLAAIAVAVVGPKLFFPKAE